MSTGGGALLRLDAGGPRGAGRIGEVVLDRPAAMNSLNTATLAELAGHFTALGADPTVSAVIVSAAGERAFCAGADLKERAAMSDQQILAQRPAFRAAFAALLALPQPAIAAVHGFALGGGCELALSCDVIVEDAAWRTAASSADRREGIAAFAEKRRPAWPSQAGREAGPEAGPELGGSIA